MPKFLEKALAAEYGAKNKHAIYGTATEADWHWLAGIFEGEGTATMSPSYNGGKTKESRKRGLDRIVMAIPQKTRQMLDEVKRITGVGSIHPQTSWAGWHWVCACRAARITLSALYPYLRTDVKKAQVRESLEDDAANRAQASANKAQSTQLRRDKKGQFGAKVSGTATEEGIRLQ